MANFSFEPFLFNDQVINGQAMKVLIINYVSDRWGMGGGGGKC